MTSLYETLGVARDATEAEINAAYRKRAKEHHPDHGGKREDFEALTKARDLLVDPKRRADYDRTGSTEETVDNEAAEVMTLAVNAIDQHLGEAERRGNVFACDFIAKAIASLAFETEQTEEALRQHRRASQVVAKLAQRFHAKKPDVPNRLRAVFERRVFDIEIRVAQTETRIRKLKAAIDLLGAHSFETDAPPPPPPPVPTLGGEKGRGHGLAGAARGGLGG